jgi:hypothetical protein
MTTNPYRPSDDEQRQFAAKLDDLIMWGLAKLKEQAGPEAAVAVAEQFDRRQYRLRTRVDLDANDEPDLDTLWYLIEVFFAGGWHELVEAKWTAFGISEEGAREEAAMTALQNGYGTVDVPDDLSSLTGPPTDDQPEA